MKRKKFIWAGVIFLALIILGSICFFSYGEEELSVKCVPASCCHATSCVPENEAPNCSLSLCTMDCQPGTLDCGQARCEYVDNKCEVVINE